MIDNPFAVIDRRINRLESLLLEIKEALPTAKSKNSQDVDFPFGDFKWLQETCSGIPASTLRIKSAAGEIPGMKKVGKRVLYEKSEVFRWIRSQSTKFPEVSVNVDVTANTQIGEQLERKKEGHVSIRNLKTGRTL